MPSCLEMGFRETGRKLTRRRSFLERVAGGLFLALVLGIIATTARAENDARRTWLVAYEVLPLTPGDLPGLVRATYEQKAAVTQEAAERLVPVALKTLDGKHRLEWTRVGPGGYAGEINPSIYTSLSATRADAERVAAAIGYVLRQTHVLIADLADRKGNVGMVEVEFKDTGLTPLRAAGFLRAAHLTLASDDLGFSALDDRMIFLNLGTGIENDAFHAGIAKTAIRFPPPPTVSALRRATAFFVSNNWKKQPDGEAYAARLGGEMSPLVLNLRQLRARHRALIARAAKRYGWR